MNDHFVICGCGELAWARRLGGAAERGPRGHHDWDEWVLQRDDPPPNLSLGEKMDGVTGLKLSQELPEIRLQTRLSRPAGPTVMVWKWDDLANELATMTTQDLQGPGILVTPRVWSQTGPGRSFLRPWASQGWYWSSLEDVLNRTFSPGTRTVAGGRIWLRFTRDGETIILPNGPEAAYAVAVASQVVEQIFATIEPALALEWRQTEATISAWYTHQKIVRRINEALRDGARSVELASPDLPLFAFSDEDAAKKFEILRGLQVTLELPSLSAAPWWEQIAEPGFLNQPGKPLNQFFNWGAAETLLLGRISDGSTCESLQALHTYLRFNGQPFRLVDPTSLLRAFESGTEMSGFLQVEPREEAVTKKIPEPESVPSVPILNPATVKKVVPPPASEKGSAPPVAPVPTVSMPPVSTAPVAPVPVPPAPVPPVSQPTPPNPSVRVPSTPEVSTSESTALSAAGYSYDPSVFQLEEAHHPGFLRVFVDGERIAPDNVVMARQRDGKTTYNLSGSLVARGSIVRVDFEPTK